MAHLVVLLHEFVYLLLNVVGGVLGELLQLLDDATLGFEVATLFAARSGGGFVACLEELVAGGEEVVPELVAELLGHHAYGLPLLLQCDELVAG